MNIVVVHQLFPNMTVKVMSARVMLYQKDKDLPSILKKMKRTRDKSKMIAWVIWLSC